MISEESRLNLAHQHLKSIPRTLITSYQATLRILDMSYNEITNVSFLSNFKNLSSIILDHNEINCGTSFPELPAVRILWVNHNLVRSVQAFIPKLAMSFPNLAQLSMMGNPGVPLSHEDTYYGYLRYRLFVIWWFEALEYLDDRAVTEYEREEATRLFGSPPIIHKISSVTTSLSHAITSFRRYLSTASHHRPNII